MTGHCIVLRRKETMLQAACCKVSCVSSVFCTLALYSLLCKQFFVLQCIVPGVYSVFVHLQLIVSCVYSFFVLQCIVWYKGAIRTRGFSKQAVYSATTFSIIIIIIDMCQWVTRIVWSDPTSNTTNKATAEGQNIFVVYVLK